MRWYKGTDLWVGRQRSGDHWSWTAKGKHVKRNLKHREKLKLLRALPVPRGTQTSVKRNISSLTRKPKRGTLWSSFTNTVPCLIKLQFKFLLLYQRTYTHPHSIWIVSFLSGVGGRNLLECSFSFHNKPLCNVLLSPLLQMRKQAQRAEVNCLCLNSTELMKTAFEPERRSPAQVPLKLY